MAPNLMKTAQHVEEHKEQTMAYVGQKHMSWVAGEEHPSRHCQSSEGKTGVGPQEEAFAWMEVSSHLSVDKKKQDSYRSKEQMHKISSVRTT